ncbi:MAG TPA: hypothetical protein VJY64_02050 [Candidatus Onthovivens sp.]|nr:hypothetical protein [Candidatus Onthovivens sp.]
MHLVNETDGITFDLIFYIVIAVIIIIYIGYIVFSFSFMSIFKKKIVTGQRAINVLIFQKADCLFAVLKYFEDIYKDNEVIKKFLNNDTLKVYNTLKPSDFHDLNIYLELVYKEIKKIYATNLIVRDLENIKSKFSLIDDINNRYFVNTQIYNGNVLAYTYWRNLLMTKYIKNIFKVENIESIK